jgi:uncharacterized OB-fold protein
LNEDANTLETIYYDDAARAGLRCPECGSEAYYPEGGCKLCHDCGYSPCK